jgi:DNA-binding GntR family transcriptional regulator
MPIYHQISGALRARIIEGALKVGDKLPSEKQLSDEYEVSRITLRQALAILEREGVIRKQKGMGAFVAMNPRPIIQDLSLPSVLGRKLAREGIILEPEVLTLRRESPSPGISDKLRISHENYLVFVERLFLLEGHPIALNRSWLSEALVPDMVERGLVRGHLSVTLTERYGLNPVRIDNTIESAHCTPADMKLLRMDYQSPAIIVTATSFDPSGNPIEFSRTIWLGDRVKFHFDIISTSS